MNKIFALLLLLLSVTGWATDQAPSDKRVIDVVQSQQIADAAQSSAELLVDYPGQTPLSTMLTIRARVLVGDYESAAELLDMRYLPDDITTTPAAELMHKLVLVWRRYNLLDVATLSNEESGHLDDGLPSYRDIMADFDTGNERLTLYLQRIPDPRYGKIWKISNQTVKDIPALWDRYGYSELALSLGDQLPHFAFLGLTNWQTVCLLAFIVLGFPFVTLLVWTFKKMLSQLTPYRAERIDQFFLFPIKAFFYILFVRSLALELGLPFETQILLGTNGGGYLIWMFLSMGLVDIGHQLNARRLEQKNRAYVVALLRPLRMLIKLSIVVVTALLWAENAGYNMSTIIAGLGVSGVAIALAAQKTLENVIGAFTIYIARPIKPGDFCRFGSVSGTVEEIGLRSTLIRTLDRTLVFIPNSVFSAAEVENYSARDKIRYLRHLRVRISGSADEMRVLLTRIRELLAAHPKVESRTSQVQFDLIGSDALQIRVMGYLVTTQYAEYLQYAEDLNLRLLDIIEACGLRLAVPEQHLRVEQHNADSDSAREVAEETVRRWREEDRLPFPELDPDRVSQLADSLDYPPAGSVAAKSCN